MRAVGLETKSLFGDPLFVDPDGRDFRFQPNSPALVLGIDQVDVSKMGRMKNRSRRISDGTEFVPQDHYPKFSWDTTPMYYMFGDSDRLFSTEEVKFIAERTNFLTIEMSHGLKPLGAAELGAQHEAAAFKKLGLISRCSSTSTRHGLGFLLPTARILLQIGSMLIQSSRSSWF
jgi:hypothetical protein